MNHLRSSNWPTRKNVAVRKERGTVPGNCGKFREAKKCPRGIYVTKRIPKDAKMAEVSEVSGLITQRDSTANLSKRLVDRRPFCLCRNSFMEKHVGEIVCYNGQPTRFSAHRRGCLIERVSWKRSYY